MIRSTLALDKCFNPTPSPTNTHLATLPLVPSPFVSVNVKCSLWLQLMCSSSPHVSIGERHKWTLLDVSVSLSAGITTKMYVWGGGVTVICEFHLKTYWSARLILSFVSPTVFLLQFCMWFVCMRLRAILRSHFDVKIHKETQDLKGDIWTIFWYLVFGCLATHKLQKKKSQPSQFFVCSVCLKTWVQMLCLDFALLLTKE